MFSLEQKNGDASVTVFNQLYVSDLSAALDCPSLFQAESSRTPANGYHPFSRSAKTKANHNCSQVIHILCG